MKKILIFVLLAFPSVIFANSYLCTTDSANNPLGMNTVKVKYSTGNFSGSYVQISFIPPNSKYSEYGLEMSYSGKFQWEDKIEKAGKDAFSYFGYGMDRLDITIVTETHLSQNRMTYFDLYEGGLQFIKLDSQERFRFNCKSLD